LSDAVWPGRSVTVVGLQLTDMTGPVGGWIALGLWLAVMVGVPVGVWRAAVRRRRRRR